MFNTMEIGKRITEKRKEKNLTQTEIADKLGISTQAVSNWERGNSMPDISKLSEICDIFDMSIDELLGRESTIVKSIAENKLDKYIEKNLSVDDTNEIIKNKNSYMDSEYNPNKPENADNIPEVFENMIKDICDAAPIIKPNDMEKIMTKVGDVCDKYYDDNKEIKNSSVNSEEKTGTDLFDFLDLDDLSSIVPFAPKNMLKKLTKKIIFEGDGDLSSIINFVSENDLEEIVAQAIDKNIDLTPFADIIATMAGKNTVKMLFKYFLLTQEDELDDIAPHISSNDMEEIICEVINSGTDLTDIAADIAPFANQNTLSMLLKQMLDLNSEYIEDIMPFMDAKESEIHITEAINNGKDLSNIAEDIAPFLNNNTVKLLFKQLLEQGEDVSDIICFVDQEDAEEVINEYIDNGKDISEIAEDIAPFLNQDFLTKLAIRTAKEHGFNHITNLSHFIDKEKFFAEFNQ